MISSSVSKSATFLQRANFVLGHAREAVIVSRTPSFDWPNSTDPTHSDFMEALSTRAASGKLRCRYLMAAEDVAYRALVRARASGSETSTEERARALRRVGADICSPTGLAGLEVLVVEGGHFPAFELWSVLPVDDNAGAPTLARFSFDQSAEIREMIAKPSSLRRLADELSQHSKPLQEHLNLEAQELQQLEP